ncbi:hypothetical protein Sste5346_004621 [Sporothrix stenoceras]|uniref:RNA polymerase II holoenzyme cyclin-like subunit n=1 Tax=Sporothrix stenoceras TaxID=5173 RepID=A0ABR3Z8L3_9PEZI
MASMYRAPREAYQPPPIPQPSRPQGAPPSSTTAPSIPPAVPNAPNVPSSASTMDRQSQSQSQSPSSTRRRDVPPAVPSPPTHSSRNSPPHRPLSRRSASPRREAVIHHHQQNHQSHQSHNNATLQPHTSQPRQSTASPAHRSNGNNNNNQPPFANQWFFTDDELASTPSVLAGITPADERERRSKGVNFIYQSGIAVRPHPLPQMTLYVAAIFFHRFYMRTSMLEEKGGIHHYKIAATAMFLANKTEENCFKTKNIIIAVAKVAQKNMDLIVDEQSKEYWRWRDVILTYEELMLETLTFDLVVANPYDQLWSQLRKINQLGTKPVREAAWSFLNDSALTQLPLALDASDLAAASIFFASIATGETVDDVHGRPWWQYLRADEKRITRATHTMVKFYTDNPLQKKQTNGRIAQGSPVFQLEATRRPHELAHLNCQSLNHNSTAANGDGGHSKTSRDVTPLELDQKQSQPTTQSQPTQSQSQTQTQTQNLPSTAATSVPGRDSTGPGDSDVALKVAANDLDHHPSQYGNGNSNGASNGNADRLAPNGNSNGDSSSRKRKSVEPDDRHDRYRDRDDHRERDHDRDHRRHSIEEGEYNSSSSPRPAKRARRTSEGEVSEEGER